MKRVWYYRFPVGDLGIAEEDGGICNIFVKSAEPPPHMAEEETPLLRQAAAQLEEYFAGRRERFDLPLQLAGTEFQRSVWAALQQIPYGQTRSYGQIAAAVGNPKGSRAVGMANNRNPVMIVVPCHRVIGGNGAMVGYAGGLEIKRRLLDLEQGVEPLAGV